MDGESSTGNLRNAKRLRIDHDGLIEADVAQGVSTNSGSHSGIAIEPDTEIWMEDGNIVLSAGGAAFCVYKGLLATQSEVFRDMFVVGSIPKSEDEIFQGRPAVHTSDSKRDLKHFLCALLPQKSPWFYRSEDDPLISPQALSAVIQLSYKYRAMKLQEQALSCLRSFYTDDFDTWQRVSRDFKSIAFNVNEFSPIEAIHLARLTDSPSILPAAFYQCVTDQIINCTLTKGYSREDGTHIHLDLVDIQRCIDGQRTLTAANLVAAFSLMQRQPCPGCTNPAHCSQVLSEICRQMRLELPNIAASAVEVWYHEPERQNIDGGWDEDDMCRACLDSVREMDEEVHKKIWIKLPEIFSLPVEDWSSTAGS
ncbi:hypothetical protein C8Q78DRAFT_978888 [Trametes maxima]|nr:hypothetical protein C8Q78DRAFT_978888 [Trametes maxima]